MHWYNKKTGTFRFWLEPKIILDPNWTIVSLPNRITSFLTNESKKLAWAQAKDDTFLLIFSILSDCEEYIDMVLRHYGVPDAFIGKGLDPRTVREWYADISEPTRADKALCLVHTQPFAALWRIGRNFDWLVERIKNARSDF